MQPIRTITLRRAATAALATVMTLSLLPAASMGSAPGQEAREAEWKVLAGINQLRASRGLMPLRMAQGVRAVAQYRSQEMRDLDYFSHTSPTGRDAATLLGRRGVFYYAGSENIGWITYLGWSRSAGDVVDAWFDSSGHRANLLSSEYNYVGIGLSRDSSSVYATAIFVRQNDHTPPKSGMAASGTGIAVASAGDGKRLVTIRWWGYDRPLQRNTAGLKGFTVQKQMADGRWRTLRSMTQTRQLTLELSRGAHKFRVRATDNRNNRGMWRHPLRVTVY